MSDVSFRQTFINYAKDGVLDKSELEALKKKATEVQEKSPDTTDAQIAEGIVKDLDKYDATIQMTYSLTSDDSAPAVTMRFNLTPTYSEKDKVKGDSMGDAIANISQGDSLKSTTTDGSRCGAATMLNIAMRTLASQDPSKSPSEIFAMVASKAGVPTEFTYENVHKAQDKLYTSANTDGKSGINAGYSFSYDQKTGDITSSKATSEVKALGDKLGLKLQPLIGTNKDTIDDKRASVDKFFTDNPNGSVMVGVNMDDAGKIIPPDNYNQQNHFVEIYKKDDKYFMKDTGATTNGKGKDQEITDINAFLYTNTGTTLGVTR